MPDPDGRVTFTPQECEAMVLAGAEVPRHARSAFVRRVIISYLLTEPPDMHAAIRSVLNTKPDRSLSYGQNISTQH